MEGEREIWFERKIERKFERKTNFGMVGIELRNLDEVVDSSASRVEGGGGTCGGAWIAGGVGGRTRGQVWSVW